ncbi:hypothetical protein ACOY5X_12565 [Enterobacter kobei]|uniref:hypothetical protein n=1 Tax=Enterobacter kobei TaxID=208224 RepID=UPI003BEECC7B
MINFLKKKIIAIPLLVFSVIIFNGIYFHTVRGMAINSSCFSVLRGEEFAMKFNHAESITLVLNPDRRGYVSFSGNVSYEGKNNVLQRDILFQYEKESSGVYKLYDVKTVKHFRDTTPDILVEQFILDTHRDKTIRMTFVRTGNALVVGNLHSPVFMCVIKY